LSVVGIVANPASGKDIRRLVAFGSVFDNQEKVRIVRRVILGLAAAGVERICYMPDYFGIVRRAVEPLNISADIRPLEFPVQGTQEDSTRAGSMMKDRAVSCIVTVGGDGTNRAVAKGCNAVPILPISTGTNNVFPYMVEGTIAGLAAGLVALERVPRAEGTFRSTMLEVVLDGRVVDLALVDAAVCDDLFVASRAVWDMTKVLQVFLNRAHPDGIGLSSIGGLVCPVNPQEPRGLCLDLGPNGQTVTAPVAPGVVQEVSIECARMMRVGEDVAVRSTPCVLALDGEREVEIRRNQRAAIRLSAEGPVVVDVKRTMHGAMKEGVFGRLDSGSEPRKQSVD
jgi:predicted polyphosphate/ATP-dependent NAD kinase